MELENLKYNPKNAIIAVIYFIFGSFLVWWSHDKVAPLTSVFDNNLPKILIWGSFILMYLLWLVVTPYLCLTGRTVGPAQFIKTFAYGFLGAVTIVVMLPIMQTIITALSSIFSNTMITNLIWIVTFIVIAFFAYYKPIAVLTEDH